MIRPTRRLPCAALLAFLSATAASAQDPAAEAAQRLQTLLQELSGVDAKVWAARQQALEQQAKAHDQRAAELRMQAAKLNEQAAAADAEAKGVRAEMARLAELQKLLHGSAPAKTEPAKGDPAKPEPAKPEPAKPEPAKAEPPKAEPPKTGMPAGSDMPAAPVAADAAAAPVVVWPRVDRILQESCVGCHDASEKKGGFDASTFASARKGGGSGRTIVPGEPDRSRLWLLVSHQERPFMPRGEPQLPQAVLQTLRTWIEQGACEDEASARAFVQQRAAAAKAIAAATAAADVPGPLPENLPALALRVPARPAPVKSLARSPNAPLLAMPGLRQVLLFDAALHPLGILPAEAAHLEGASFSADGTLLAVAGGEPGRSGSALVYDVHTGALRGTFGAERDVPLAVAVHAQRGLVGLGGSGKRAQVVRLDGGGDAFAGTHDDFVLALAFSPDGSLLAAADRSGAVKLWETDGGRLGDALLGHRGAVNALAFARSGRLLASAGADGTVRAWDVAERKEAWKQAHAGEAAAVAFGPDDAVASCGSDGRIKVFSREGKPLATSPEAGEWLYAVAFGDTAEVVFAGDWQGRVHRFDVKAGSLSATVPLQPAQ